MKKNFIFKIGYIVFTILCFSLCGFFPDIADLLSRIWYVITIIVWCVLAVNLLSLSLKYSKSSKRRRRKKE